MSRFTTLIFALLLSLSAFATFAQDPVNINTADATELAERLNGVGPAKAEAIIAWRDSNGAFETLEQLAEVRGIGLRTVEINREVMTVGSAPRGQGPARQPATPGSQR
jgi:competence protein ComEA